MTKSREPWAEKVLRKSSDSSPLVVGIDPVNAYVPTEISGEKDNYEWLRPYVQKLVEVVSKEVGFVKFQSAFFERYGHIGIEALSASIELAKSLDLAVILDAKRGDIGSTAAAYAEAYLTPDYAGSLSRMEVDCMTINPFLGPQTMEPFLNCCRKFGKGVFILAKTSNPDAGWIQDQAINGTTISERIAFLITEISSSLDHSDGLSPIGAVVGATYPEDAQALRKQMPNAIFLAPGLGSQGGSTDSFRSLARPDGTGVVISASRGITKIEDRSISESAYFDRVLTRIKEFKSELASE